MLTVFAHVSPKSADIRRETCVELATVPGEMQTDQWRGSLWETFEGPI